MKILNQIYAFLIRMRWIWEFKKKMEFGFLQSRRGWCHVIKNTIIGESDLRWYHLHFGKEYWTIKKIMFFLQIYHVDILRVGIDNFFYETWFIILL